MGLPLASPRFAHPIPKSRRRNRAGLVERFLSEMRRAMDRRAAYEDSHGSTQ